MVGNLTNYIYSTENQLVEINEFENNVLAKKFLYKYDALGRRFSKGIENLTDSSKSFGRRYVFDGEEVLAELDENSVTLGVYTQSTLRTDDTLGVDVKDTKLANSTGSYFYLKDSLGSIIDIVDGAGNLIQHYAYSSFGELLKISDSSGNDITADPIVKTSYGYTNRELDVETGMMYYRARYYMPEIGRFISVDSDPGRLLLPVTLINKYIYTGNNLLIFTDPSGKSFLGDVGRAIVIAAIIVAAVYTGGAGARVLIVGLC